MLIHALLFFEKVGKTCKKYQKKSEKRVKIQLCYKRGVFMKRNLLKSLKEWKESQDREIRTATIERTI